MFDYEGLILAWQEEIEIAEFNGDPLFEYEKEELHYNPIIERMKAEKEGKKQ